MLVSSNPHAELALFADLVARTTETLNSEAQQDPGYYATRDGIKLEKDVCRIMAELAQGTPFADTIQLKSGKVFPDVVANNYFGLEVKTSVKNHWVTLGNSVLESTRAEGVERIFLLFGKLADPIQFRAKPYEECLAEVMVTHYPRYKVDMDLRKGQTIFDKIGIDYDSLRGLENPVAPLVEYYKSKLRPGESLWWVDNGTPIIEDAVPMTLRLFNTLSKEEKDHYRIQGLIRFPILFSASPQKYSAFILWMASQSGIISSSTRDLFSAGGQRDIQIGDRIFRKVPQKLCKVVDMREMIAQVIQTLTPEEMAAYWPEDSAETGVSRWMQSVVAHHQDIYEETEALLRAVF